MFSLLGRTGVRPDRSVSLESRLMNDKELERVSSKSMSLDQIMS